jgi:hypothetical protein
MAASVERGMAFAFLSIRPAFPIRAWFPALPWQKRNNVKMNN